MPPKVFAVVLNYNRADDTRECLGSLAASDYPGLQLILVDNGSADRSWKQKVGDVPNLIVIETGENLGYAGGNNRGIRKALDEGADYVLVLNNDTTVDPAAVSRLVAEAEREPRAVLLAPLVCFYDEPDSIDSAGTRIDWLRMRPEEGMFRRSAAELAAMPGRTKQWPLFPGSALLLRRPWIEQVGLFDERLFLIHEDSDLCLRNLAAGGVNLLVPSAKVFHKRSKTLSAYPFLTQYYTCRNFLFLALRRGSWAQKLACAAGCLIKTPLMAVRAGFGAERSRQEAAGWLAGLGDFLKGKSGRYSDKVMSSERRGSA